MKPIIVFILLVGLLISCQNNYESIKPNKLIGRWLDINTCDSCLIFEFDNYNNMIAYDIRNNRSDTFHYRLPYEDSILISKSKEYMCELIFYTPDSIMIDGFSLSVADLWDHTRLIRID